MSATIDLDCDPCVNRPARMIKAIVHGTKSTLFWQQVRAAAVQAATDLRISFEMELYDEFNVDLMISDIINAVSNTENDEQQLLPDALIVTVPSEAVHEAVKTALKHVPVFGLNSGYDVAESLGLLGFVAMDEYVAGQEAAKQFTSQKNITKALFVNSEKGNKAIDQRFEGFTDIMLNQQNNTFAQIEELVVVGTNTTDMKYRLRVAMQDCPYNAVLLSDQTLLEPATSAFAHNGCTLSQILLGTFDTSSAVYDAIAVGKLSFAVSQQQHLQGALSVVMAATYVTTGTKLARSAESDYGIYFSGPNIVTLQNLPSDTLQRCEEDSYPVCPNTKALDGITESKCDCTDRSKLKIGGVVHGATTDKFWDVVFAQAQQAANDMGVQLIMDRLKPEATIEILRAKMASKILSLCQEGVNGVFVSLPSEDVIEAVKQCQALSIPVISVNTGAQAAVDIGVIHHLAQDEYTAGLGAGERLIAAGMTTGLCLLHVRNHPALKERCRGFEEALRSSTTNVTFLGVTYVPFDNMAGFVKAVEDVVDNSEHGEDWEGIGALLGGSILVGDGLLLQQRHSKLLLGSFDATNEIFDAIAAGHVEFGIDQVPFLQGYMPVTLLTWLAYTNQAIVNTFIETGPSFVDEPPSTELQICQANLFEVCPEPVKNDLNQLGNVRAVGWTLAVIVLVTSLGFIVWVIWNRNARVVKASQPAFLVMICIGTLVMGLALIPLGIDDGVANADQCSKACMAVPWLFTTGFMIAFAALFSKIARINKLVAGAKECKRLKVSARDVMLPFVVLLTLTVVFLLIWTCVDPMYWDRHIICGSGDLSSYGVCEWGESGVSIAMLSCILALIVGALIIANVQAYKARKVSTEFSESKYVGIVMICLLQISFIGIPLIVLTKSNPTAGYVVRCTVIFVICMSILLLIFVPKVLFLRKYTKERKKHRDEMREHTDGTVEISSSRSKPTFLSHHRSSVGTSGLRISGANEDIDLSVSVMQNKLLELERLLQERGVDDAHSLFREAGIIIHTMDKEAYGDSQQIVSLNGESENGGSGGDT